jgi:hypothetical protein
MIILTIKFSCFIITALKKPPFVLVKRKDRSIIQFNPAVD